MSNDPFEELSNEHWAVIERCLSECSFPKVRGTPRTSMRRVWNSILYVLIRGCRWKELPRGQSWASKSTAHLWLKKMRNWKIFDSIFLRLLKEANFRGLIDWQQLNVDGSFSLSSWRRRGSRNRLQG